MSMSKIAMMMAAALIGAGLCAADAPEGKGPAGDKPAMRGGRGGRGGNMDQRMQEMFQLTDAEKEAVKAADETVKTEAKKIREKAEADMKKFIADAFDAKLKTYKEAAARLTDEKAKKRAERMIEMMENNRERAIEFGAKRAFMPERPRGMGPGRGGMGPQGKQGPRGPRGDRPAQPKAE